MGRGGHSNDGADRPKTNDKRMNRFIESFAHVAQCPNDFTTTPSILFIIMETKNFFGQNASRAQIPLCKEQFSKFVHKCLLPAMFDTTTHHIDLDCSNMMVKVIPQKEDSKSILLIFLPPPPPSPLEYTTIKEMAEQRYWHNTHTQRNSFELDHLV